MSKEVFSNIYPEASNQNGLESWRLSARKIAALAGIAGATILSANVQVARAEEHPQSERAVPTRAEALNSNPVERARRSNKTEIGLLKAVREKKHPAALFNGALEFTKRTNIYLGPVAKKSARVFADANRNNDVLVSYYPMLVPVGKTLWAAVFDNRHATANYGQGSAYGNIGWIPLNESRFKAYKNPWDGGDDLLHFSEAYHRHPQGHAVPDKPVYEILPENIGPNTPRSDLVMDTNFWLPDYAAANMIESEFQEIENWSTVKYSTEINRDFRK
jgi:hypothetical protein